MSEYDPELEGDEEDDAVEVSEDLASLIEQAIEHAAESVQEGGVLVPFVITDRAGELEMRRFVAGEDGDTFDVGESVTLAQRAARESEEGTDRAVVVYDGYVTIEDEEKMDCFFVEAFEAGAVETLLLVQTYRSAEHAEGFALVGDTQIGDTMPPMW